MELKVNPVKKISKWMPRALGARKKWLVLTIGQIILLLTVSLSSIAFGMHLFRTGKAFDIRRFVLGVYYENFAVVPNYLKSIFAAPERIMIDVSFDNFQKLVAKRQEAIERGVLFASPDDFVPADIRHNGETLKAQIRLKGDCGDHWLDKEKWSFRVRIRDNETLFGMKRFSIQRPVTRSFLNEWYFHKLLSYSGLINLRFDFIDVTLNGNHLGIYALEEHFDKLLIENNHYREGVIMKFDDELLWHRDPPTDYFEIYAQADVDAFQTGNIQQDEVLFEQFRQAKNLLEAFRRDVLTVSEVFDIEKMALLFAIADLSGQHHSTAFSNIRFYYNPVASKLEPVGYDNHIITPLTFNQEEEGVFILISERKLGLEGAFLQDEQFFKEYIKALKKISDKDWLDRFFKETESEYKQKLSILHKDFPWYRFEYRPVLYQNQEFIKNILKPPSALRAHFKEFDFPNNRLVLELGNTQFLPLEIIDVAYKDDTFFDPFGTVTLSSKKPSEPIMFQNEFFFVPAWFQFFDSLVGDFRVRYRVLGDDVIREEPLLAWTYLDKDFLETDLLRKTANWKSFVFTRTDEQDKIIFIKTGIWNLNSDLIFPKGYRIVAEPGTVLNLSNSAKILSRSPLRFIGEEDRPITLQSKDGTGQGLFVLTAEGTSELKRVLFKGLSLVKEGDWRLTSSVTFYESPVDISYVKFENNSQADDYLNIIRSEFVLQHSLFENTFADAVDLDFAKGRITDVSFINCGLKDDNGDALDLSGSSVTADDLFINGAGDKGLSVGEDSSLSVDNASIQNTVIAVAVKDNSMLDIKQVKISDSRIGFAVFQKKSEFGPAEAVVESLEQSNVESPYLVEEGSVLSIGGSLIESNITDAADALY